MFAVAVDTGDISFLQAADLGLPWVHLPDSVSCSVGEMRREEFSHL